jgi:hypothetical protein
MPDARDAGQSGDFGPNRAAFVRARHVIAAPQHQL